VQYKIAKFVYFILRHPVSMLAWRGIRFMRHRTHANKPYDGNMSSLIAVLV